MNNKILVGDALFKLKELDSQSIDCCVTSPPYYGLRDYGVEGQIGLEETPEQYIDKLVKIFREVKRILKEDGTLWVNIADSYAGSGKGAWNSNKDRKNIYRPSTNSKEAKMNKVFKGIKRKDLIGIPWMLAFALRADGWYLRQDIIWHKPNAMPESAKDRCTKCHEYIFLLSKNKKYYFDYEAIKEPCVGFDKTPPRGSKGTVTPNSGRRKGNNKSFRGGGVYTNNQSFNNHSSAGNQTIGLAPNKTGLRNKRNVWTVATRGYKEAHFATYPTQLIEPCILAGSREGGTVLDPFAGSGTTGKVANIFGRSFVGIEINKQYIPLIENRLDAERMEIEQ